MNLEVIFKPMNELTLKEHFEVLLIDLVFLVTFPIYTIRYYFKEQ
jgi:hypothetical protein